MKRIAFKMHLNEGQKNEYKKRHDEIWPELKLLLIESGVSEYSIFLDEETNILFAFQKVASEGGSQDLGQTEIVKNSSLLLYHTFRTYGLVFYILYFAFTCIYRNILFTPRYCQ
jgi:L-rhamnose mutarotase